MTPKEFIEKAIEGGWQTDAPVDGWEIEPKNEDNSVEIRGSYIYFWGVDKNDVKTYVTEHFYKFLLDPKAWEAVGKVEGWGEVCSNCGRDDKEYGLCDRENDGGDGEWVLKWKYNFYRLPVALILGMSIEEYLKTLTTN